MTQLSDFVIDGRAEGRKVYLISLGCDKNTVDAEYMLGDLISLGFTNTEDPDEADLFIVNTCCFIDSAKEESVQAILSVLPYLKEGEAKLIVSGCMAERYKEELSQEIPEIDGFIGVKETDRILSLFDVKDQMERQRVFLEEAPATAYLKISEGCNRKCTYCAIPGIRGPHRSRNPEEILDEVERLKKSGIKELIVVSQDLTQYGSDHPEYGSFPELLDQIADSGIPWIRLLYLYPEGIDEELIDMVNKHENILPYFDMPIQHTTDKILKRMGRRITREQIKEKLELLRERIPNAIVRTSIIVGFPGESKEDFNHLLSDLKEFSFDRLGVFTYSQEEGTPAASFDDQIPDTVKSLRKIAVEMQQGITTAYRNKMLVNHTYPMLIETVEDDYVEGRLFCDAPEIDGMVYVDPQEGIEEGSFVQVHIDSVIEYEFTGTVVPEA